MEYLLCLRAAKQLPDFYYLEHFYRIKFESIANLSGIFTRFLQILVIRFGKIGSFGGRTVTYKAQNLEENSNFQESLMFA